MDLIILQNDIKATLRNVKLEYENTNYKEDDLKIQQLIIRQGKKLNGLIPFDRIKYGEIYPNENLNKAIKLETLEETPNTIETKRIKGYKSIWIYINENEFLNLEGKIELQLK